MNQFLTLELAFELLGPATFARVIGFCSKSIFNQINTVALSEIKPGLKVQCFTIVKLKVKNNVEKSFYIEFHGSIPKNEPANILEAGIDYIWVFDEIPDHILDRMNNHDKKVAEAIADNTFISSH